MAYIVIAALTRTGAGARPGMAKDWIENLAQEIKNKNHEAAENYGRDQHYAGIITTLGKGYFMSVVTCLQENVDGLRRQLQGDSTSAETGVETIKADEIKITRARFPWVDARVIHKDDIITLDYAKGPGVKGDPKLDRKTQTFTFRVAQDDSLYVEDAFADQPKEYKQPEDLARRITEVLFAV
jgi:hypothetical protein